jgi:uncharacterized C2H2 Zn-finger protein
VARHLREKPRHSHAQPRLVNGRLMSCPRCKKPFDVLAFIPLMMVEEYAADTTPVYKCPACRWVFAPAESVVRSVARLA